MYKEVILIQVDSILSYPPTLSVIHELSKLGLRVTVLTTCVNDNLKLAIPSNVNLIKVGNDYKYTSSIIKKMISLFVLRKKMWENIDKYYNDDTILWVMSNITVKHLGGKLVNYNYNLHLFELVEKIAYINNYFVFDLDLRKLALSAKNVVVCEYNRAQITRAWLQLTKLPLIVSNKPMDSCISKNAPILHSEIAKKRLNECKEKKIILYQGIVDAERPIEPFAKVVEQLDDEYVFVVMTGSDCNFLKKYKNTVVLPYISAPYHLEVTSHAAIGILIYTPIYGIFTSPLNSIYCAPNKLYEYSQFGIPMIGNDIPGLKYTIESNKMGVCVPNLEEESILYAIKKISKDSAIYESQSRSFYKSEDKGYVIKQALMK
jgi:glycosyltransferase involved in cell wall biosynthesis